MKSVIFLASDRKVGGINLQVVLEEIKELRKQLLNTIENNNRLRKQLEIHMDGQGNVKQLFNFLHNMKLFSVNLNSA